MDIQHQRQIFRHQLSQYQLTQNISTQDYCSIHQMIHLQTKQQYIAYSYPHYKMNQQKLYNQALSLQKSKYHLPIQVLCWKKDSIFLLRRKEQGQIRLSQIIQNFGHKNRAEEIHSIKFICELVKKSNYPFLNQYINADNIIRKEDIYCYDMPILPSLAKSIRKQRYFSSQKYKNNKILPHQDEQISVNFRLGMIIIQILNKYILEDSQYMDNLEQQLGSIKQENLLQLLGMMLVKKRQLKLSNIIQLINDRADQMQLQPPVIRISLISTGNVTVNSFNQGQQDQQQQQLSIELQNYSMYMLVTSLDQINISIYFKHDPHCTFSTKLQLSNLPSEILPFCPNVSQFFDITQNAIQNKKIEVSKDGFIEIEIANYHLHVIVEETRDYFINNQAFPSSCNAVIANQKASYRASLVGPLLVLTSASAFFDREQKVEYKKIYLKFENLPKKYQVDRVDFPKQYMSCSDEDASQYNYGIAFLKQQVQFPYFYNFIYDYKKIKSTQTIEHDGKMYSYKLNLNGHILRKSQFESKNQNIMLKYPQQSGSPLLIQFQKERYGMIGMAVAPQEVMLFNEDHFYNIYRFIQRSHLNLQEKITFRSFSFENFNFYQPEIPFVIENRPFTVFNQKLATALVVEIQVDKRRGKNIPLNIIQLQKILTLYLQVFGQDHWKISALNYRLGRLKVSQYLRNHINPQLLLEVIKHLQCVVTLQKKYRWNLMFLAQSQVELANIFSQPQNKLLNSKKCLQSYVSAIQIMEKTENMKFISNTYINFALFLKQQNRLQQSIEYHEKSLKRKIQEKEYEGVSNISLELSMTYKGKKQYRLCIDKLNQYRRNLRNVKVNNINTKLQKQLWDELRNQLTPELLGSDQILKKSVAQLIKAYYPDDNDILTRKIKQNIEEVD